MARIVFGGALSHSPMMNFPLQRDHSQVERFKAAVEELGRRLRNAKPDAILVYGPDHFRALFYDLMPAFVIAVGAVKGWGDWDTPRGPFPGRPRLAAHILESVMNEGFDPASSLDIKVDHGITQPLQLLGLTDLPVIPIVINAAGPPLPAPLRCHEFGAAVGRAIASFPEDIRVALLASGGLSHDPPSPSNENALHGRTNGFAASRARETSLIKAVDTLKARINAGWDRIVLDHFVNGTVPMLASGLTTASIFEAAGNGGQEIRTWIALAGALGDPEMNVIGYEPIDELITGMGVIST